MALKLITNFEENIWKEWSERLKVFSKYRIRSSFYPKKMDELNSIIKLFVENQRESTKYLISKRNEFPDCWSKLSQEDKNNWNENTKRIKEFNETLETHIVQDKISEFLSEIDVLEKQRICDVLINYTSRIHQQGAEDLIYFSKKANEEHEKEIKTKEKRKTTQQKNTSKKVIKNTFVINKDNENVIQIRQRSAKLDCKRKLRHYYQNNE
tara:strand:- start:896 stop:1525 length:630 start_codon:yes stop_codon:yes gene_type:complete